MRYWLLRRPPHYTEIHSSAANTPWDYDKVFVDVRLKPGDVVYLTAAADELYGWGYVIKRESYREQDTQTRAYRVTVTRPVVEQNLVTAAEIKQLSHLRELFADSNRNLVPLKAIHVNAFNALLRSKAAPAPTDLDFDEPESERVAKDDFPKLPLTPNVATWLNSAYVQLRQGKQIKPTEMLVELWTSLSEDFDYETIDSRLMRFGVDLTLLGILHVDPATDLVEKTDKVIRFIRELIIREPAIGAVTSEQISEDLTIPEQDVALIFGLISHLGDFWNGGAGYGDKPGYYSVTIRDEKVKRQYLKYRGIDELLKKLGADQTKENHEMVTRTATELSYDNRHFDVCLSFAGEDRLYVEGVAAALLSAGVTVFYDNYEQVSLWGKDLYQHLDDVYRNRGTYCVVFISRAYSRKLWTKHELRSAQGRAFEENREYILPVRLDDTELAGVLPTTGYVSNKSPEDLAELIIAKLQQTNGLSSVTSSSSVTIDHLPQRITLRNGSNATAEERAAFVGVWGALVSPEAAGRELWKHVSGEALSAFADRQREARQAIGAQALFFSEPDYDSLEELMRAADFFLEGKTRLSNIYNGLVETRGLNLTVPTERDTFMDEEVRAQLRKNRRWLTRYQKLLRGIRSRLHERIA